MNNLRSLRTRSLVQLVGSCFKNELRSIKVLDEIDTVNSSSSDNRVMSERSVLIPSMEGTSKFIIRSKHFNPVTCGVICIKMSFGIFILHIVNDFELQYFQVWKTLQRKNILVTNLD